MRVEERTRGKWRCGTSSAHRPLPRKSTRPILSQAFPHSRTRPLLDASGSTGAVGFKAASSPVVRFAASPGPVSREWPLVDCQLQGGTGGYHSIKSIGLTFSLVADMLSLTVLGGEK